MTLRWLRTLVVLVVLCARPGGSRAAAPFEPDVRRSYDTSSLPRRNVPESLQEAPRAIQVITQEEIRDRGDSATPAALEDAPAVYMQRTNGAGGAPVLRGLIGQHVLLLVDGIRLNNAITRYGPNQALNTVDVFQVEHIETLFGPGAVLYGSDAMGGVINLVTRQPRFDPRRAWDGQLEAIARFDSATYGGVGHLAGEGHLRNVGLRLGGSYKRYQDMLGGQGIGRQPFTHYWEGNVDTSLAWVINERHTLRAAYATVRQHDAPRSDRSSPDDYLVFSDQLRDLGYLRYRGAFNHPALKQLEATISFHSQRERRDRHRLALERIDSETDQVHSLGALLALRTDLPANTLTYGVDVYYDWVGSSAQTTSTPSTVTQQQPRGRYIDGASYLNAAIYLMDRITLSDKLAVDLGGRFVTYSADLAADPTAGLPAIDVTNIWGVGSLHSRYLVGNGLNFVAGISSGFRAPNIDDYSALGCSGQGFDVPNPDLTPEKSVTAETGLKLDLYGRLTASLFYYFTHLRDLIVRQPSTFSPSSGTVDAMPCGTASDGSPILAPVTQRINAQQGNIHGIEAQSELLLGARWSLFAWLAWTHGEVTLPPGSSSSGATREPMSRIPPLNGLAGLRHRDPADRWFAEFAVRWATRQNRLAQSDLGDRRICPAGPADCRGTPGYAVLTLRGAARLQQMLRLTLAVRNLTHQAYRTHGSGIYGEGISALVGLEFLAP